jgi:class 3 adenylate cyclase
VLTLVARGDEGMFKRMAKLFEPGRRQAAMLFADLQMSGALSRRLPSAAKFRFVRAITTAIDEAVVRHTGIVGKHAGDGVTALFLADDLGSSSAAAEPRSRPRATSPYPHMRRRSWSRKRRDCWSLRSA